LSEFNFTSISGHQTLASEMAFVLSELDRQFFPTPWALDAWQNLFLEHDRLLILVEMNETAVGFCLFDKSVGDSFAHLLKILIHPQHREAGLAKVLLDAALTNLKLAGCSQFFLEVEETNLSAIRLYEAHGFQSIHKKKDFYGANRSALIMTKS
jgi:ribosomal-protein-alanine N-acetyltransferase